MDIQSTAITAKMVIHSLLMLLENENVDISSLKFKVGFDGNGYESPEFELEKLVSLAIDGLVEIEKVHAAPEGFVLVKQELPEEIAEAMALERVERPSTETDPIWIKISEDAYKGRLQSKKWELWRDYKAMIEAQENE